MSSFRLWRPEIDPAASKGLRKRAAELDKRIAECLRARADAERMRRECDEHDVATIEIGNHAKAAGEMMLVSLTNELKLRGDLTEFMRDAASEHLTLSAAAWADVERAEQAAAEWLRSGGYQQANGDTMGQPGAITFWNGMILANPGVRAAKDRVESLRGMADQEASLSENDVAIGALEARLESARRKLMAVAAV